MSDAIHEVLDRWTAAFNNHQSDAMADLFTADALFQDFGPEVLSDREAVRDYHVSRVSDEH
ncbi:nuclear transport factor 2 family protein [Saccharopolyspora shandongensis]|uniref:nuclear transport factor 2 family protein n=1 Tax=Saccharopolyspora shandongensis TaxID=418495 RepID=UPI00342D469E